MHTAAAWPLVRAASWDGREEGEEGGLWSMVVHASGPHYRGPAGAAPARQSGGHVTVQGAGVAHEASRSCRRRRWSAGALRTAACRLRISFSAASSAGKLKGLREQGVVPLSWSGRTACKAVARWQRQQQQPATSMFGNARSCAAILQARAHRRAARRRRWRRRCYAAHAAPPARRSSPVAPAPPPPARGCRPPASSPCPAARRARRPGSPGCCGTSPGRRRTAAPRPPSCGLAAVAEGVGMQER